MKKTKHISNKLRIPGLVIALVAAFFLLISATRQLRHIGNADGLDTANVSGAMRVTRAYIARDTFTYKPGDFFQLWRNSSKLTYIDSAGRFYGPEMLIGTTTRAGYEADINGEVRFGTHLQQNVIRGSLNFDNATNTAYIMQGGSTIRSIYIPGTGGNANWIFNNAAGAGVQVANSSVINNNITLQPGTNASTSPPSINMSLSGYALPNRILYVSATSAADVNMNLGTGDSTYANNVGYNIWLRSGKGGSTGNNKGGNIYLSPGMGGGTGATGDVVIANCKEYADNAAAIAAGLPVGAIYRTGDDLKIVH